MTTSVALVGRAPELRLVHDLVTGPGSALVLEGERGAGRSALGDAAAADAAATGMRVLRLRAPGPSGGSPLEAGNRLLADVQREPTLLLVDDADRLDEAPGAAVLFAARRLSGSPSAFLATVEPHPAGPFAHGGLPRHRLPPLSDRDARELIARFAPDLPADSVGLVVAHGGGAPLALAELAGAVGGPASARLSLTPRLLDAYGLPLEQAGAEARRFLVAVALAEAAGIDPSVVVSAGLLPADQEGERLLLGARGLGSAGPSLGFRHPVTRLAVLAEAEEGELRDARGLLAAALDGRGEGAAWRLWDDVAGPSERDAAELERVADRALRRGDFLAAEHALERAAALAASRGERARLLLRSARLLATVTGDLDRAEALLGAGRTAAQAQGTGGAATAARLLLAHGARVPVVRAHLDATMPADGADGVEEALQLLGYLAMLEATESSWATLRRQLAAHPHAGRAGLGLLAEVLPDVASTSAASLRRLDAALAAVPGEADPAVIIQVAVAAFHLDRLAGCRAALGRLAADAREGRAGSVGAEAMLRLALDDAMTGQLDLAARTAEEGLALSRTLGQHQQLWPFDLALAMVAAFRGDRTELATHAEALRVAAETTGATLAAQHRAHVLGLAALADGAFEAAYGHACSVVMPGTAAPWTPVAAWIGFDLVEAAARSGRPAEAASHAERMRASGIARLSPRMALRVGSAEAVSSTGPAGCRLFEAALAVPGAERWPMDVARTQLAYGEHLRRLRASVEARLPLELAHETFRTLGARPWAHRAAEQLRAAGAPMPEEERPTVAPLTGDDLVIARLAAAGLSNRQIGERLHRSPRTIGSRLYRIFPRLGVTSRAGLRAALERAERSRP